MTNDYIIFLLVVWVSVFAFAFLCIMAIGKLKKKRLTKTEETTTDDKKNDEGLYHEVKEKKHDDGLYHEVENKALRNLYMKIVIIVLAIVLCVIAVKMLNITHFMERKHEHDMMPRFR